MWLTSRYQDVSSVQSGYPPHLHPLLQVLFDHLWPPKKTKMAMADPQTNKWRQLQRHDLVKGFYPGGHKQDVNKTLGAFYFMEWSKIFAGLWQSASNF